MHPQPVVPLAIIGDVGACGLIRSPGFVESTKPGLRMLVPPTCPYYASNLFLPPLGAQGIPGRLRTFRALIHVASIWISVTYREREKETTQRRQRECSIRVCILCTKRDLPVVKDLSLYRRKPAPPTARELCGSVFLARSICTIHVSQLILVQSQK